ncbi:ATP-dependent RecD-like DNA helicase [Hydrogenoanaerobacterium sp.]|uniref:SF1B family DNA helicase RecD2 n=1 Tax=Hydrogenoanaerobacterium sp. TaxID=2953763 RepID=UPI0028A24E71|nr:ATP-dependent RecD-like DNA helicase [Hydrogenoanaerobacterium sp.]
MQEQELEKLEGTVEYISFHSDDTGFTVLGLAVNNETELVTVVGEMVEISEGEHLSLLGEYAAHPTYGQQFRVSMCEKTLPATANAILKYLSSKSIKGIGPVLANRLVGHFGNTTLDIIEKAPERLTEVKGISPKKAQEIAGDFKRIYGVRMVMMFLSKYNVHPSVCVRVWKKWGGTSVEVLSENPYLLCTGDLGLTFAQADAIAMEMEFPPEHPHRVNAALAFVLRHNLSNGHTCLPEANLLKISTELLGVDRVLVEQCLFEQIDAEELISLEAGGKTLIYLPQLYCAERYISGRLLIARSAFASPDIDYSSQIDSLEQSFSIEYEGLQRKAISAALNSGVFILTGGPGTGKTTTINAIIELFEQMGEKVLLAAPTGRAAKRMAEMTGREAKTIHRLLEVDFKAGDSLTFKRNERNPLDAGVLIIDEMSMVDTLLFESLLRAMRLSCRLVLVGDADQLPSVGAGNVLRDMIDSDVLYTVHLQEIFRQAAQSLIVTNAHQIVRGEHPDLNVRDNDFFFLRGTNFQGITETLVDLIGRRLPKAYGFSPKWDIQVLSPTRKSELGTVELNRRLQQSLNPPAQGKNEFKFGGYVFREGDKIMQIRNNYDIVWEKEDGESGLGIFNGDIGEILQIDKSTRMLLLRFDDKQAEYSFDMANELELGYAITVHKSQGSEFEAVIIPLLHATKNLYYRNLLYTAVTRAKRLLILLGDPNSVYYMVDNNKKTLRYTNLAQFLRDEPPIGEE